MTATRKIRIDRTYSTDNTADATARNLLSVTAGSAGFDAATGVISIPTNTNQLTNGAGFITSTGIPSQSGNSGKYLTTDGSSVSWATVSGGGGGGTLTNPLILGAGLSINPGDNGDLLFTLRQPAGTANAYFGNAVASSGNYTVVGAWGMSVNSGNAYVFNNTTGALMYTLTNPNSYGSSGGDRFGHTVAINGNYIVIGAFYEDSASGTDDGVVYFYDMSTFTAYSGSTITIASANSVISNPNAGGGSGYDYFSGTGLAVSSSYVAVSSYIESAYAGKVYVFSTSTRNLMYTFDNPNAYSSGTGDYFGSSIALYGNTLVVGASDEDQATANQAGKVYVFDLSSIPSSPSTITSSNYTSYGYVISNPQGASAANDYFGSTVAVNATYVAVGSGSDNSNAGIAYIFNRATGTLVHTITIPDKLTVNQFFAKTIAMSDTQLVVGCNNQTYPINHAYVYSLETGKLLKVLANPNSDRAYYGDTYSAFVSITNDYIAVSASTEPSISGSSNSGAVYLFTTKNTFDGSASSVVSLAPSGAVSGVYGTAQGVVNIPQITVDKFGRVVGITTETYNPPAAGLSSALTSVAVDGTVAFYSSGQSTINFEAGDNVTLEYSTNISNYPTITINSTGGGGGGGGGGAFKYTLVNLSGSMTADFSLPADATISTSIFTVVNFPGSGINMPIGWQIANVHPSSMGDPSDMLFRGLEVSGTQTATFNTPSYGSIKFFEWVMDSADVYYSVYAQLAMVQSYQQSHIIIENVNNSYNLNWFSAGYCYGYIIAGGGGWSDLETFVPAANVDAYVDATNQIVFFKCPASIWYSGGGEIGGTTSQAMNASMYLYLYYFGQ